MRTLPTLTLLTTLLIAAPSGAQAQGGEASKQPAANPAAGAEHLAKDTAKAKAKLLKTGDHLYEIGDLKFNSATREITLPVLVNMADGILEYALVHENGKTHESLLSTKVKPMELNLALLLCHYEPHLGEAAKFLPDPTDQTKAEIAKPMEKAGANKLYFKVTWKDKEGQEHTKPLTDWIEDRRTRAPLKMDHWTYTGSLINEVGYAAEFEGTFIAIYFDLVAMVNSPVEGNSSDDHWYVNTPAIPPVDTPVTLTISPKP